MLYFEKKENIDALVKEVYDWKGTQFQRNTRGEAHKGGGCDCISFCLTVYKNLNIMPLDYVAPSYRVGDTSEAYRKICQAVESFENWCLLWDREKSENSFTADTMPGDLVICTSRYVMQHTLICLPDKKCAHVYPDLGFSIVPLESALIQKRIRRKYRYACTI
jgi:cell wall-associated NlpC family hydrolase